MQKTKLQKFIYGFKEGLKMNSLPDHILKIDKNFYVKIFKFIGAFCIFLSVSKISYQFPRIITYIIYLISFLYSIYKFVIVFYVIKEYFSMIRHGKFIVRNSPVEILEMLGKLFSKTVTTTTKATIGTGIAYTLAKEIDDILEEEGKDRFLIPKIHETVESVPGLKANIIKFADAIGIKDSVNLTGIEKIKKQGKLINETIKSLSDEDVAILKEHDIDINSLKNTGKYLENLDKKKPLVSVKKLKNL